MTEAKRIRYKTRIETLTKTQSQLQDQRRGLELEASNKHKEVVDLENDVRNISVSACVERLIVVSQIRAINANVHSEYQKASMAYKKLIDTCCALHTASLRLHTFPEHALTPPPSAQRPTPSSQSSQASFLSSIRTLTIVTQQDEQSIGRDQHAQCSANRPGLISPFMMISQCVFVFTIGCILFLVHSIRSRSVSRDFSSSAQRVRKHFSRTSKIEQCPKHKILFRTNGSSKLTHVSLPLHPPRPLRKRSSQIQLSRRFRLPSSKNSSSSRRRRRSGSSVRS